MTGDVDTGLGNSLIAAAAAEWMVRRLGVRKYELLVDGDDVVVITEIGALSTAGLERAGKETGFIWEITDPVVDFGALCHCRSWPIIANGRLRMCRDVRRAVAGFGCTHRSRGGKELLTRLRAMAMSEWAVSRGVPIIHELVEAVLDATEGVKAVFQEEDYRKGSSRIVPTSERGAVVEAAARLSVATHQGIPAAVQRDLAAVLVGQVTHVVACCSGALPVAAHNWMNDVASMMWQ